MRALSRTIVVEQVVVEHVIARISRILRIAPGGIVLGRAAFKHSHQHVAVRRDALDIVVPFDTERFVDGLRVFLVAEAAGYETFERVGEEPVAHARDALVIGLDPVVYLRGIAFPVEHALHAAGFVYFGIQEIRVALQSENQMQMGEEQQFVFCGNAHAGPAGVLHEAPGGYVAVLFRH